MAAHDEDEEEHLPETKNLTSYGPKHDLARVSHIMYVRISELELSNHEASICGEGTKAGDKEDATEEVIVLFLLVVECEQLTRQFLWRQGLKAGRGFQGRWFQRS